MAATDEAIVLAGGLGTRLRGAVDGVPKPLAPVSGRPFLAWIMDALAGQGMRHVVLATGYLGGQVEAALGKTWRGMTLAYSRERSPLGTGGALALALSGLSGETFFALNGDTWLELDYAAFAGAASGSGVRLGVAVTEVPDVARYGAVRLHGNRMAGFDEKGTSRAGFINAGVYWMRRSLLEDRSPDAAFSFEREVLMPAASRGAVFAYADTRGFIDIGVPEDYQRAQAMFGNARTGVR